MLRILDCVLYCGTQNQSEGEVNFPIIYSIYF